MTALSWFQLVFYLIVLLALAKPLGTFMARVYQGESTFLNPVMGPVERSVYRLCGVHPEEEMNWKVYALAVMLFNGLGLLALYALQRLQGFLPLNLQGFAVLFRRIRPGTRPSASPPIPTGRGMAAKQQ